MSVRQLERLYYAALDAAKIERGESVTPPGVPPNYPDAKKLVTEVCIRPLLTS